jgi:hypothetical protein
VQGRAFSGSRSAVSRVGAVQAQQKAVERERVR